MAGLARGPGEHLVAVRGPGAFLGEMAAFAPGGARCASVRARGGPVRARVVPGEALRAAVERVPEVRLPSVLRSWSCWGFTRVIY